MKYRIYGSEADYESGSEGQVLKNKLCLNDPAEMNQAENQLLLRLYEALFQPSFQLKQISVTLLRRWHRMWLGALYDWAGQIRTVHMSKGDFRFASVHLVPSLLEQYEQHYLSQYPLLATYSTQQVVEFLAQSHVELILIHPFREGNGRLARLLLDVMATQAGFTPLDYSLWDQNKGYYVGAIHAGVMGDYGPMQRLVQDVLCEV